MDMKITNNYNMPAFRGYKNLISYTNEVKGHRLALFSVQLDNNGTKDLDNYKKLAQYNRNFTKADIDDTLMCLYSENPNGASIYLNNDILLSGDELKDVAQRMPANEFSPIEAGYLKAYTQLAGLSKRIISEETPSVRDNGFQKVTLQSLRMLTNLCDGDTSSAYKIIQASIYNVKPPKTLSIINSAISKALKNYF